MSQINKVWVGGLPDNVTEIDVASELCDFGRPIDVKIIVPSSKRSYAFVEFENGYNPEIFCTDIYINNEKLLIKRPVFHKKGSMFRGGLPHSVTDQTILKCFSEFDLDEVQIFRPDGKVPFAFLTFYNKDDLEEALTKKIYIDDYLITLRRYGSNVVCLFNLPIVFSKNHYGFRNFLKNKDILYKFYRVKLTAHDKADAKIGFYNHSDAKMFHKMMNGFCFDGMRVYSKFE